MIQMRDSAVSNFILEIRNFFAGLNIHSRPVSFAAVSAGPVYLNGHLNELWFLTGIQKKEAFMKIRLLAQRMRIASLLLTIVSSAQFASLAAADGKIDDTSRIAVMSSFEPELSVLLSDLKNSKSFSVNGIEFFAGEFEGKEVVLSLSGISIVNAAMSTQILLDSFNVEKLLFSGIAGGVNPDLNIGDVVVADRWGQYFELVFGKGNGCRLATIGIFRLPLPQFRHDASAVYHCSAQGSRCD